MQKFILPHIEMVPGRAAITGQDARHVYKVLRLKPGDHLNLTNAKGVDFTSRIRRCGPDRIDLDVLDSKPSATESELEIILCTGMLKDKKMDFVIKHTTQLGIWKWVPFYCDRSVPVPDPNRMKRKLARWQTIAQESLKQCRRSRLPDILPPLPFKDAVSLGSDADLKLAFWENANHPLDSLNPRGPVKSVALLIGPEGGFTEQEIDLARSSGFDACSLGPRILRAETAAISCCTLIQHLWGDI